MGTFYENNPDLRYYFESLPIYVKNQILESGAEICTLGELMQIAEHFKSQGQQDKQIKNSDTHSN